MEEENRLPHIVPRLTGHVCANAHNINIFRVATPPQCTMFMTFVLHILNITGMIILLMT